MANQWSTVWASIHAVQDDNTSNKILSLLYSHHNNQIQFQLPFPTNMTSPDNTENIHPTWCTPSTSHTSICYKLLKFRTTLPKHMWLNWHAEGCPCITAWNIHGMQTLSFVPAVQDLHVSEVKGLPDMRGYAGALSGQQGARACTCIVMATGEKKQILFNFSLS